MAVPHRFIASLLLLGVASSAVACSEKVDVPDPYKPFAPTEGLTKTIKMDVGAFGVPTLRLWHDKGEIKSPALWAAYRKRIEGEGFEALVTCEKGDDFFGAFMKDKKAYLDISVGPLGESDTLDVQLAHTKKGATAFGYPKKMKCEFTELGDELCKSKDDGKCELK